MIKISDTPPDELDLSGTPDEYEAIIRQIRKLNTVDCQKLAIDAKTDCEPNAYSRYLEKLQFQITRGATKVSVIGNKLLIEGSIDSMSRFCSFMQGQPKSHVHHDYLGTDEYVHPDSLPLVISFR